MKKLLLSLLLSIMIIAVSKAQDKVKYQGATFPVGSYWEVVVNEPEVYFKSKMKDKSIFWFVQYLGENLSNEDASKSSIRFLQALKLDMSNFGKAEKKNMRIGKKGVAARLSWKGKNKNGKEAEHFAYLYNSAKKKGVTKYFIMLYQEECEAKDYCDRYWLHRESYEKEFQVK